MLLQLSIAAAMAAGGEHQAGGVADEALPAPSSLTVDASLPPSQADAAVLAARRFYAFWNTGEERCLGAAVTPWFTDRTLPKGRPQVQRDQSLQPRDVYAVAGCARFGSFANSVGPTVRGDIALNW